jgi:hypothetical protein
LYLSGVTLVTVAIRSSCSVHVAVAVAGRLILFVMRTLSPSYAIGHGYALFVLLLPLR